MIIQSYNKNFSGGIGDFIKGSVFIYRNCINKNNFFVDFKHHPISEWIENKNESSLIYSEEEIENLDICSDDRKERIGQILKLHDEKKYKKYYTCSLYFDFFEDENLEKIKKIKLTEEEKIFFKNCFGFNKISKEYEFFLKKNNIKNKYLVSHFRLGDLELLAKEPKELKNKILNKKEYDYNELYYKIKNKKTILLSDSENFKKFVKNKKNKNIIIPETTSSHSAYKPGFLKLYKKEISVKNMKDLAIDIKILSEARVVDSYSSNWWGSGFSFWICQIYDIPINMNFL